MKKIPFLFAMLASVAASAQATVTPIGVDYDKSEVKFRVAWNAATAANNRVWVWVDFCSVAGTTPGTFAPATITSASVTSGAPSDLNGRGFFVTVNGATVTATLSNASGKFNWCAYGSDYPPNVTLDKGTYTFKGTASFIVSSHAQPVTTNTITKAGLTVNSSSTFTDATGCPGIGSLYCPYTGSDLYMDVTHLCQQRTSGAQNWEAWIKDSLDNELYRIVKMPDNKWWLAQNVKLASYNGSTVGAAISGCTKDECGRGYTWAEIYGNYGGSYGSTGTVQGICPPNWLLPLRTTYATLISTIGTNTQACQSLRASNASCSPRTNDHGFASLVGCINGGVATASIWYTNDAGREDGCGIDLQYQTVTCNVTTINNPGDGSRGSVRCYRTL
ncbi:MAG: hypothetical protein LBU42_06220 [Prevotellaceae bacterium]|nr:hypothetical protein [Prevotellaceae bacterium]